MHSKRDRQAKKLVSSRLSLRCYDCPILLKHVCQTSQNDPLPAYLSFTRNENWLDYRVKPKHKIMRSWWDSNTRARGDVAAMWQR